MKKRRKKQRRGISAGTLVMLLLTLAVLAGCAGFMAMIAGEQMRSRAGDALKMIEQAGITLMSEAESALLRAQEKPVSTQHTAIPQSTQAQSTPAPKTHGATTFTLAAAGTIHAPKAVRTSALSETGEYDFSPVLAGLGDVLGEADLAIATLETMTAGKEKGYGNYNAPAQLLSALRERGLDLLSLATERAFDKGYDGLAITTLEMTASGIAHTGVTLGSDSAGTSLIGIDGVQVAVLGYTYGLSSESKGNTTQAEREAVHLLDMIRMEQDIRQARADGANVVIVMPHWGTKNKQETPEEVREMARALAKAGADVILGTHPNVVQGTERLTVTRADGLEYETVVCYSLGSLLSDARTEENTAGMIAHLPITYDPQTRRVSLGSLACSPVYIAMQKEEGQNVYRVIDVENAQALQALTQSEKEEALRAAKRVREITGQSDLEKEGQG